jgi:putative flippase GtrA
MNYSSLLSGLLQNKTRRFLFSGLINSVFGYSIYAALIYLELPYLIALLISTILGVIFNFFNFGRMVFGRYWNWFVFCRFVIAYALIYVFNSFILIMLTNEFMFSPYLGQVLCIPPSIILSWILMNCWVYK